MSQEGTQKSAVLSLEWLNIENEGWLFKTPVLLMTGGIRTSLEPRQESSEALSGSEDSKD